MARNKKIEQIADLAVYENKNKSIEDGLSEIYQDDKGRSVDVKRFKIKKHRKSFLFKLSSFLAILIVVAGLVWIAYYYLTSGADLTDIQATIEAPKSVNAGEENFIIFRIKNNGRVGAKNVQTRLALPANFVLSESSINFDGEFKDTWDIGRLASKETKELVVKGRFYGTAGSTNLVTADVSYRPENFSSDFKKAASAEIAIGNSGINVFVVKPASVLAGQKETIIIKYKANQDSKIDNFRLTVEPQNPSNIEFIQNTATLNNTKQLKPWVWQVYNLDTQEREIRIDFKILDKVTDKELFKIKAEYWLPEKPEDLRQIAATSSLSDSRLGIMMPIVTSSGTSSPDVITTGDKYFSLNEQSFDIEIVKNDLNMIMILNGSDKDISADFGQTLRYSINYENKGQAALEDVVIMATLDGNLVNWASLQDKYRGALSGNTITWTKSNLPELASIGKGEKGVIDFSVNLINENNFKSDYVPQMTSVAKFQTRKVGDISAVMGDIKKRDEVAMQLDDPNALISASSSSSESNIESNNFSNTIVCKLNSDLRLDERIRYFDDDNIPVGSGPIPFEVGKTTNLRVYWQLSNTLHDLSNVRISIDLPPYVKMSGKERADFGNITYDVASNRVVWEMNKFSKLSKDIKAEFNIALTPTEDQRNQILILLPKTKVIATDDEVGAQMNKEMKAKTTKLEDDDIIKTVNIDLNGGLVK